MTGQKVRKAAGGHPRTPIFGGAGSILHQKEQQFLAVAIRCQMYLALLRLSAHERRDKQTCQIMPLSYIADYGAAKTCKLSYPGLPAKKRTNAPHLVSGFGWQVSRPTLSRGDSRSMESSIQMGAAIFETIFYSDPPHDSPAKPEDRNQRGSGDLLGTFQSLEKYLGPEAETP